MKINKPRKLIMFGLILGVTLVAAACTSQQNPAVTQEDPSPKDMATEPVVVTLPTESPEVVVPTEMVDEKPPEPTGIPTVGTGEQSEGYPAPGYPAPVPTIDLDPYPSPDEAVPPPPVKTALEATDPSTVILASGKPQLIEFFAFW